MRIRLVEAANEMTSKQSILEQRDSMVKNKRNLQTINRKLSSVLDASPLKNSYIGKIFHDRYQNHLNQNPDGSLTLATILSETLSKLKQRRGPNKAILKPLPVNITNRNNLKNLEETKDRYSNNLQDSFRETPQPDKLNKSPEFGENSEEDEQQAIIDGIVDLDELADEDKFFLIQQIEDLNKNIRYTCKQEDIFEDEEVDDSNDYSRRNTRYKKQVRNRANRNLDVILDEEEENQNESDSDLIGNAATDALRQADLSPDFGGEYTDREASILKKSPVPVSRTNKAE